MRRTTLSLVVSLVAPMLHGVRAADATPHLVLLTEAAPLVTYGSVIPIHVAYVAREDEPVPDAFVSFVPQSDTADTALARQRALTNDDGEAYTFIEGGVQVVDFDVVVSVPDPVIVEW